jgi:hypothetical protein
MANTGLSSALVALTTSGVLVLTSGCGSAKSPSTDAKSPTSVMSATPTPSPTSNGISALSAKAILAAVARAGAHATSVHVHGTFPMDGKKGTLDLHIGAQEAQGTMTAPAKGSLVPVEIVVAGGKFYLKSPELWRAMGGATMAQLIGDRWAFMSNSQPAGFKEFTTISGLMTSLLKPTGPVKRGQQSVIDGQPVIALKDSDGSVMYVATTGEPLPVRMVPPPSKAKPGEYVDFTEWNASLTITPPADAIDIAKLKQHQ